VELLDILKRVGGRRGLAGKVVAVYCRSPEGGGGMFGDVRIVQIGFNPFLVGRSISRDPKHLDRWDNVINWIAVSEICRLIVFDNVEEARRKFRSEPDTEPADV
jgi:hypothetical protein